MFLAVIKRSIRRDFVVGRIASIDGWQVAATELAIVKSLGFPTALTRRPAMVALLTKRQEVPRDLSRLNLTLRRLIGC